MRSCTLMYTFQEVTGLVSAVNSSCAFLTTFSVINLEFKECA